MLMQKSFMQWGITDLRLFSAVIELSNLTKGARQCNLSVAAASVRIRALEEQAGCQLLVREARGVRPTYAGIVLAQHARSILNENHLLSTQLREFADGMQGHVRILANTTACTEIMPTALARFLRDHREVSVRLQEGGNAEIANAVRCGSVDLGVLAGDVDFSGLDARMFSSDRIVAVTCSDHPFASSTGAMLADISQEPVLGLHVGASLRDFLDAKAKALGLPPFRYRVEVNNYEAMCLMAQCGVGIAILGKSVAKRYSKHMDFRIVPLNDSWAMRHRYIVNRCTEKMPDYILALIDSIASTKD